MLKVRFITITIIVFLVNTSMAQTDSLHILQHNNSDLKLHSNTPYKFNYRELISPGIMIAYGVVKLNDNKGLLEIDKKAQSLIQYRSKKMTADNYTQFAPAAAVYGLNLFGVKGRHNYADLTVIYASTVLLTTAVVQSLKRTTKVWRPDGSSANSFPSGHTATAFAAAEFLRIEYKEVSPWIGAAGYFVASGIGVARIYNNRHWLSDVIAGAGIGMLCTKTVYWLYPSSNFTKRHNERLKQRKYNALFLPTYQKQQINLSLLVTF